MPIYMHISRELAIDDLEAAGASWVGNIEAAAVAALRDEAWHDSCGPWRHMVYQLGARDQDWATVGTELSARAENWDQLLDLARSCVPPIE
jgi:hypothetical protein